MGKTGTKKLAKGKTDTQFCIDGYLVGEVLGDLPTGVEIIGAKVLIGSVHKRSKIVVPNKLKRLGVQKIEQTDPSQQATLVFDKVSKTVIKDKCALVSRSLGVDPEFAFFKYITLRTKDAVGKFEHCTKEIKPDETDLRKKLRVLGLTDAEGKVANLVKTLSAKKYQCTIQMEEVRTIMCSNVT